MWCYFYRRESQSNMPTALNTSLIEVHRLNGALTVRGPVRVAIEDPLEIQIGQERKGLRSIRSASVTMRTPGHDDELAIGFLLARGFSINGPTSRRSNFPLSRARIGELRADWAPRRSDCGLEAAGSELLHHVELRSLWKSFASGGAEDSPRAIAQRGRRVSDRSHDNSPNARATSRVARDFRANRRTACSGSI